MPCADLARIHSVIAEIIIGDSAVLKADQSVAHDNFGIEIHLHFGIHGNGLERGL